MVMGRFRDAIADVTDTSERIGYAADRTAEAMAVITVVAITALIVACIAITISARGRNE